MELPPLKKRKSQNLTPVNPRPDLVWRLVGLYGALGVQMIVSFLIFFWLGNFLDQKFKSAPWFLLVGMVLGMIAGGYQVYWAMKIEKKIRK